MGKLVLKYYKCFPYSVEKYIEINSVSVVTLGRTFSFQFLLQSMLHFLFVFNLSVGHSVMI